MPASAELFTLHTPAEAWAKLVAHWRPPVTRGEDIETEAALGRVLARAIAAREDLPAFRRSTVDGYAVQAIETHGASASAPALLRVSGEAPMGQPVTLRVAPGSCVQVHTGSMLPADVDAVVMIEHTQRADATQIEVMRPVAAGENILQIGEDIRIGSEAYAAGAVLRPHDIGALMGLGVTRVLVAEKPRVGIVSSGDEVVPPNVAPGPGQVRDVNSYALAALVQAHGGAPRRYGIVPDDRDQLTATLKRAQAECDIVVISAGSSVSARDLSMDVIASLGAPGVLVHGVAVKPGKPTIIAVCDGVLIFGLPGNPASALAVAELLVVPALWRALGADKPRAHVVRARLGRNVPSATGRLDVVPVNLEDRAGELWALPVFGKSNLIYTLVRADGRIQIELNANGVREGEWVDVLI